MKVYISGKVTGLRYGDYTKRFCDAEIKLRGKGCDTMNPVRITKPMPQGTTYEECMRVCMVLVGMCDAIYMLDNWEDSPGAKAEKAYAEALGLDIMYEREETE
jgi:hypothetical protein